jgi:glycosyltransferase involved in cell wall biosynthesis
MKVLFVSPNFFPFIGGAENHILRICLELKKSGHEVAVFTSTREAKDFNGIKVYSSGFLFKYSNTPINFWGSSLQKAVEKEKPEIIAASFSTPFMADTAARTAKKNSIPFFLFYFNDYAKQNFSEKLFLSFYFSFVLQKTFGLSKKIIVLSDYYKNKSKLLFPLLDKTVSVSPFVNLNEFNCNKKEFSKKILFVGSLSKGQKYKGLDYLIKAVCLLEKEIPEIELIVIGEGNNRKYFEQLAEKVLDKAKVFFEGNVSQKRLLEFYCKSGVIVLPSINDSEGFGLVLLEAMACSKPVIGSNTGGIPALVENDFNGFLVEPKNEKQLKEKIKLLLTDQKKAEEMGKNALITAKNFSPEKSIKKLIELFEESLNEKRK